MSQTKYPPPEPTDAQERTRETRDLHPLDAKLRAKGYAIRARPKGGEPIWAKDGVEYPQTVAERLAGLIPEQLPPSEQAVESGLPMEDEDA